MRSHSVCPQAMLEAGCRRERQCGWAEASRWFLSSAARRFVELDGFAFHLVWRAKKKHSVLRHSKNASRSHRARLRGAGRGIHQRESILPARLRVLYCGALPGRPRAAAIAQKFLTWLARLCPLPAWQARLGDPRCRSAARHCKRCFQGHRDPASSQRVCAPPAA